MTELSYVLISPYGLIKSLTGTVLAELLYKDDPKSDLQLRVAREFRTEEDLMCQFRQTFRQEVGGLDAKISAAFDQYMIEEFELNKTPGRMILLVFEGTNAIQEIREKVGSPTSRRGIATATIREELAHYHEDLYGRIISFEPIVFIPFDQETALRGLRLLSDHSTQRPAVLDGFLDWRQEIAQLAQEKDRLEIYLRTLNEKLERQHYPIRATADNLLENVQQGVFMVKPPTIAEYPEYVGNFLRRLKGAGRRLIGVRYFYMTVGQFNQFYGSLKETTFQGRYNDYIEMCLQFTGNTPDSDPNANTQDASHACFAFLYEGAFVRPVIRQVIGPTNPSNGEPGQLRYTYGRHIKYNMMHGTAPPQIELDNEKKAIDFNAPDLPNLLANYR